MTVNRKTGQPFPRGARPTPKHNILGSYPFIPLKSAPQQVAYVPKQLDPWGNDRYGDCVTAEEAFAKACYHLQFGGNEIFIPTNTVIAWARSNGYLDGADLGSVLDDMASSGFVIGSQKYNDGKKLGVNFSDEAVLQSAIAEGPVKIAINANSLPSGAGNESGWYSLGRQSNNNTDHCVALCGYGTAKWLYEQLGIPLPSGLDGNKVGYLLYTWATIGFVDHAWIVGCTDEAWLRQPTTVGIPPLTPPVPPGPGPTQVILVNQLPNVDRIEIDFKKGELRTYLLNKQTDTYALMNNQVI